MAPRKKSAIAEVAEGADVHAHPHTTIVEPGMPATVAVRTYVGGPWEAYIEGQGQLPVIAIQFADGHEWLIGKGWRN